jgi:hypothetical protein
MLKRFVGALAIVGALCILCTAAAYADAAATQTAAAVATLTAAPLATQTAAAAGTQTAVAAATQTAAGFTATPTPTATRTLTFTPTNTPNRSLQTPSTRLTSKTRSFLQDFSLSAKAAGLGNLIGLCDRNRTLIATNATPLGLTDVTTVTTVEAFTTSTGAGAAKTLLLENIDFTVGGGDITPVGDHSAETWVIHYRP